MSDLRVQIKNDIRVFVESRRELMYNECDFQLQLAVFLRETGNYSEVLVEYYLPKQIVEKYDWDSNLYIDIVVRRDEEYCPVELKYPTRHVDMNIDRFGITYDGIQVMKYQGAYDIVQYNFWKDVRRIELLHEVFSGKIAGGLAVLLTNDAVYTRPRKATSASAPFSTHPGNVVGACKMDWLDHPRTKYPAFRLDNKYSAIWSTHKIAGITYYMTIIEI